MSNERGAPGAARFRRVIGMSRRNVQTVPGDASFCRFIPYVL
jgi:hypothetical protein